MRLYKILLLFLPLFSHAQQTDYLGKDREFIMDHFSDRYPKRDTTLSYNNTFQVIVKHNSEILNGETIIWKFENEVCFSEVRIYFYNKKAGKSYRKLRKELENQYEYSKNKKVYYYFVQNSIPIYIRLMKKKKKVMVVYYSSTKTLKFLEDLKKYGS
jgi:hypothetical protein